MQDQDQDQERSIESICGCGHQGVSIRNQKLVTNAFPTPSPLPHYHNHHQPTTNEKDICHNFLPTKLIVNEDNDILELC